MGYVTSADGTVIAYERGGNGPAVVLVGGGIDDGTENAPLAAALAEHFTVYNYARRGRGDSGDASTVDLAREIEDLAALIAEAGGSAHVYGVSSGGALALEAAAAGCSVARLGVYEVPYNITDSDWPRQWRNYVDGLRAALAAGRRGDAVELFMRVTGASDADLAGLRAAPFWPALEAMAHTLAHDAAALGDGRPPVARLGHVRQPTLVLTGDDRPAGAAKWIAALDAAADAVAAGLPHAHRQTLKGQGHVADPHAVVPVLERFFNE
ncbi:alpha/beta fold hydrolase [Nocardia sp. CA-135398]|uniref:alpha/beta fold hydrolase n=1 Tax=Nocardia sp. CA-135398 TaxID=3239977 RepID=UPI003D95EAF3